MLIDEPPVAAGGGAGVPGGVIGGDPNGIVGGVLNTVPADVPHVYENPGSAEARCHNVIVYAHR